MIRQGGGNGLNDFAIGKQVWHRLPMRNVELIAPRRGGKRIGEVA